MANADYQLDRPVCLTIATSATLMAGPVKAGHSQGHERAGESRTDLRYYRGGGDRNRTRAISLGTKLIVADTALTWASNAPRVTAVDRRAPRLMAR